MSYKLRIQNFGQSFPHKYDPSWLKASPNYWCQKETAKYGNKITTPLVLQWSSSLFVLFASNLIKDTNKKLICLSRSVIISRVCCHLKLSVMGCDLLTQGLDNHHRLCQQSHNLSKAQKKFQMPRSRFCFVFQSWLERMKSACQCQMPEHGIDFVSCEGLSGMFGLFQKSFHISPSPYGKSYCQMKLRPSLCQSHAGSWSEEPS